MVSLDPSLEWTNDTDDQNGKQNKVIHRGNAHFIKELGYCLAMRSLAGSNAFGMYLQRMPSCKGLSFSQDISRAL